MVQAADKQYINVNQWYGFRRATQFNSYGLHRIKQFEFEPYFCNLIEIEATNHVFCSNDFCLAMESANVRRNVKKIKISTSLHAKYVPKLVNGQLERNVTLLQNMSSFSIVLDSEHLSQFDNYQMGSTKTAMNLLYKSLTSNIMMIDHLRKNLKYFELNVCVDYNWNKLNFNNKNGNYSTFILFNIHKFINLETLKLHLCFPQYMTDLSRTIRTNVSKYVSPIREILTKLQENNIDSNMESIRNDYKMSRLKCIETTWCYSTVNVEVDENNDRFKIDNEKSALEGVWDNQWYDIYDFSFDIPPHARELHITQPSVWNTIVMDYIEYLMYLTRKNTEDANNHHDQLGYNIEQFGIKCPQWKGSGKTCEEIGKELVESMFKMISNTSVKQLSFYEMTSSIVLNAMLNGSIPFITRMEYLKQISIVDIKLNSKLNEQFFQCILELMIALSGKENVQNQRQGGKGKSLS